MFVTEMFGSKPMMEMPEQKRIAVVYPGRFQPPHKGHKAVYDHLAQKYGADNVFVCTSDKVEPGRSPFTFSEKQKMWRLMGVHEVIQSSQPYRAPELVSQFDAANTVLLFAISEKDMAEDPRFSFKPKKDGSPSYFQPFKDIGQCESLDKHGYMVTVPTFDFKVLGQPANSATQIRAQFAGADEETQKKIVTDLFGKFDPTVLQIMQNKLATVNTESVDESAKGDLAAKLNDIKTTIRFKKSCLGDRGCNTRLILADLEKLQKEHDDIISQLRGSPVEEGILDHFKKKPEPQMVPLTQEQRNFIKQYFTSTNADIKWGKDGSEYVLPHNVNGSYGKGRFHFRNVDGQLMVSVEHYRNSADMSNMKQSPITHTDHAIHGPEDMEELKSMISESALKEAVEQADLSNPDPKIRSLANAVVKMKQELNTITNGQEVEEGWTTESITKEMHENAKQGNVPVVMECIQKLMPIVESAPKSLAESIAKEVTKAVKVTDRNRDDIFEIK